MLKQIIKLLIPNEKKLAQMASDEIARVVNDSGKEETLAKYSKIADQITGVQAMVTRILVDGKISEQETEEISQRLEPLFKYLLGMI